MLFTLAMILDELAGLDPVCNHKTQKDVEIQGFFRYAEGQKEFHRNSIYAVSYTHLYGELIM